MQRVVLLSFDKDTERISFRHYGISAAPSGVTKSVKSLVNRRQLPNMGALGDVSELLTKSGYGSVRFHSMTVPTQHQPSYQDSSFSSNPVMANACSAQPCRQAHVEHA